jgi:hypothetical protein
MARSAAGSCAWQATSGADLLCMRLELVQLLLLLLSQLLSNSMTAQMLLVYQCTLQPAQSGSTAADCL